MNKLSYYIVNGITFYRILAAPVLILLVINLHFDVFKWALAISFFTDAIDGYLARRYKIVSVLGARLDSIGDDLTVAAGIVGVVVSNMLFLFSERNTLIVLAGLYLLQVILAVIKYRRITSFHTYIAKVAAVLQALFLISFFFLPHPLYVLFYAAVLATAIDLLEEIVLVILLPKYKVDVKGLFWLWRNKQHT